MFKSKSEWWNELFKHFRPFFDIKAPGDNRSEVNFLIKKLDLKKGMSFLDCPCGIGRHTIGLAKKGIKVTGVDITLDYLKELEQKISGKKLPVKLFNMDMRKISFDNEFDVVANLWTSFGFFDKESDNQLVLRKLYKALKPGGKFIIQLINRDWLIKNFESTSWNEYGNEKVLERRKFDYENSIVRSVWTFIKENEEIDINVDLRVYSYHELKGMLVKAGFEDIEGFADLKEEPISRNERMMFLIGNKPKG